MIPLCVTTIVVDIALVSFAVKISWRNKGQLVGEIKDFAN